MDFLSLSSSPSSLERINENHHSRQPLHNIYQGICNPVMHRHFISRQKSDPSLIHGKAINLVRCHNRVKPHPSKIIEQELITLILSLVATALQTASPVLVRSFPQQQIFPSFQPSPLHSPWREVNNPHNLLPVPLLTPSPSLLFPPLLTGWVDTFWRGEHAGTLKTSIKLTTIRKTRPYYTFA